MANFKTDTYKKQNGDLSTKIDIGDFNGKKRIMYFDITLAQDILAISDTISLCKLPKGAKVVDWALSVPSLGTTGIASLGHSASADAVESLDEDAFGSGIDAGGQAALGVPAAGNAGLLKEFAAEVDVIATMTEASDAADGVVVKGYIGYVID